jgi:PhnB protein
MAGKVKPIPDGYHSVTPYLILADATRALDFYKQAFGAREIMRMPAPGGKVGHAEIEIGGSRIMLADEFPEMNCKSPKAFGGSPVSIHLYVEDADAIAKRAVAAGAVLKRPVEDQFYGDRLGTLEDPFGHTWHVSTHKEDLSEPELRRRAEEAMKKMAAGVS